MCCLPDSLRASSAPSLLYSIVLKLNWVTRGSKPNRFALIDHWPATPASFINSVWVASLGSSWSEGANDSDCTRGVCFSRFLSNLPSVLVFAATSDGPEDRTSFESQAIPVSLCSGSSMTVPWARKVACSLSKVVYLSTMQLFGPIRLY